MDILYVVGKRLSGWDNNELRYSLRSIAKYGKNIRRVYIVGYAPPFVNRDSEEVVILPFADPTPDNKHYNIMAAIEHAVYNSDIADRFLYSSDDHYYTQPTDFDKYPVYWRGCELPTTMPAKPRWYDKTLFSTWEICNAFRLPTHFFAWHGNTHYDKNLFKSRRFELIRKLAQQMPEACEPACLMLNYWRQADPMTMPPMVAISDSKISTQTVEEIEIAAGIKHCLTTTDAVGAPMKEWLQKRFPMRCKYERQDL